MNNKQHQLVLKCFAIFIVIVSLMALMGCNAKYSEFFNLKAWSTSKSVEADGDNSENSFRPNRPIEGEVVDIESDQTAEPEGAKPADKDKESPNSQDKNPHVPNGSGKDDIKTEDPDTEEDNDRELAIPVAGVIRQSIDHNQKQVALTFDDGPDDLFTPQILDILKQKGVKATFFILGVHAKDHKDVLARIYDEGHAIGSHSWSHGNFTKFSKTKQSEELQKTDDLIKEVTGKSSSLFRLPYGAYDDKVLKNVATQGYHNIYWSIDPMDWSGVSPKEILNNVKQNIEPGAIILLHSSGSKKSILNTVKALPDIIEYLEDEGYDIVTINELLDDQIYK